MSLGELFDLAILAWLIGTWFYEGHHRRCTVKVICTSCSNEMVEKCAADKSNAA